MNLSEIPREAWPEFYIAVRRENDRRYIEQHYQLIEDYLQESGFTLTIDNQTRHNLRPHDLIHWLTTSQLTMMVEALVKRRLAA